MGRQHALSESRRVVAALAVAAATTATAVVGAPSSASAFSNFELRAIPLEPVIAGSTADIEFRVFNAGPDESDETLLEVGLPPGITAIGGQLACVEPSCLIGGFGLIPVGESSSRVIRVAVDPDFVVDNGAGAATANAAFAVSVDYDVGGQSGTLQVPVGERSDLRVRKYGPASVNAGEAAVYQIDVDNLGPSTARAVVVQDTLFAEVLAPNPGLQLEGCVFSVALGGGLIEQFQCSSGPVVASNLGNTAGTFATDLLQPVGLYPDPDPGDPDYVGGRLRASFTLTALDAVTFDSEVRVTAATADPALGDNLAVTTTAFNAVADLGVVVAAAPPAAAPDEAVTFTLSITNDGPSAAHGVVVRDHLPGNVTAVSAVSPDGACVSGTPGDLDDPIVCLLGTIPSGGAATVTVVARITTTTAPGTSVTNRAWVSSATADLVNTNDGAEAVVVVSGTPVGAGGLFNPVMPSRQFDTRDGTGGVPIGKLAPAEVLAFTVAGVNGIPAGVAAVALNVTVDDPSAAGWISVYPCASPPAVASSLNFTAGEVVANAVIAPVDALGQVCFRTSASTHLISDVSGWFAAGGSLTTVTPAREFDTRSGHGGVPAAPLAAGVPLAFDVTGVHGVPATGVGAVLLNVTVTQPDVRGHVTVYPCGARPLTSNGNYLAGESVGTFVVAPVSPQGTVCFATSARAHLVVDVAGWFAAGSEHHPVNPSRLFDTRDGTGGVAVARLRAGDVFEFRVAGRGGIPSAGAASAILNLTVVGPDRSGYVTAFPCGDRPLSSNVNFTPGQVVANAVLAPVSPDGTVCFYTTAALDLVVDAFGWFSTGA